MVDAAVALLRPGGVLVYSVCTLTDVEGPDVAQQLVARGDVDGLDPPGGDGWHPAGPFGARLLPHVSDTDGMYLARVRRR
jgi:16S rRNA (cytosine967-C5)-methyltransferase